MSPSVEQQETTMPACHRLELPSDVTHLIHCADLHVRAGEGAAAREAEYRAVLFEFLKEIRDMTVVKAGRAALVIAGDLFHEKCVVGATGGGLLFEWTNEVLDVLPVLVILGNHDFRQNRAEGADSVQMYSTPYRGGRHKHPLQYLSKSGLYATEDGRGIGVGVCSLRDTLDPCSGSGNREDMPDFPPATGFPAGVTRRVALFHGTIRQSRLPTGRTLDTGCALEWFRGYDAVLLGDNHQQQVYEATDGLPAWGYSGSLVQQDFGEPVFGHGYIVWDFSSPTGVAAEVHHVNNPCGFAKMDREGRVYLNHRTAVPLSRAATLPGFPRRLKVRVLAPGEKPTERHAIERDARAALGAAGIEVARLEVLCAAVAVSELYTGRDDDDGDGEDCPRAADVGDGSNLEERRDEIRDLTGFDTWFQYIAMRSPEVATRAAPLFGSDKERALSAAPPPPEASATTAERLHANNEDMRRRLRRLLEEMEAADAERRCVEDVQLLHLRWSYLLSFGPDCSFDFERVEGRIAQIRGNNAVGKSCFVDVLSLAIFGTVSPLRGESSFDGGDVINHDYEKDGGSAKPATVLRFRCGGRTYELERTFGTQKRQTVDRKTGKTVKIDDQTSMRGYYPKLREYDGERCIRELAVKNKDTSDLLVIKALLESAFGSEKATFMSSILTQNDSQNFLRMPPTAQLPLLESAFNLQALAKFTEVLELALKAKRTAVTDIQTEIATHRMAFEEAGGGRASDGSDAAERAFVEAEREHSAAEAALEDLTIRYDARGTPPEEAATWVEYASVVDVDEGEAAAAEQDLRMLANRRQELQTDPSLDDTSGGAASDPFVTDSPDTVAFVFAEHEGRRPISVSGLSLRYIDDRRREHASWFKNGLWKSADEAAAAAADAEERAARSGAEADDLEAALAPWRDPKPWEAEMTDADADADAPSEDRPPLARDDAIASIAELARLEGERAAAEGRRPAATAEEAAAATDAFDAWAADPEQPERKDWIADPAAATLLVQPLTAAVEGLRARIAAIEAAEPPAAAVVAAPPVSSKTPKKKRVTDTAKTLADLVALRANAPAALARPVDDDDAVRLWRQRENEWRSLAAGDDADTDSDTIVAAIEAARGELAAACERRTAIAAAVDRIRDLQVRLAADSAACACCVPKRIEELEGEAVALAGDAERRRDDIAALEARRARRIAYEAQKPAMDAEREAWALAADQLKRHQEKLADARRLWNDLQPALAALREEAADNGRRLARCVAFIQEWPAMSAARDLKNAWEEWERLRRPLIAPLHRLLLAVRASLADAVTDARGRQREAAAAAADAAAFELEFRRRAREDADLEAQRPGAEWESIRAMLRASLARAHLRDVDRRIQRAETAARVHRSNVGKLARSILAARERVRVAKLRVAETTKAVTLEREAAARAVAYHRRLAALEDYRARMAAEQNVAEETLGLLRGDKKTGVEGFRAWLHAEKVLPLLQDQVNGFLSAVGDFQLLATIDKAKGVPRYTLSDYGSVKSLGCASGCQMDFIGLATRVALARIGAAGRGLRYLFIDEPFRTCDADHIARIADTLRVIKDVGGYRAVVFISHIEGVAAAAEVAATVHRNGNVSVLRF